MLKILAIIIELFANVKHYFTSFGNEFFTSFGKQFFTSFGKEYFTSLSGRWGSQ